MGKAENPHKNPDSELLRFPPQLERSSRSHTESHPDGCVPDRYSGRRQTRTLEAQQRQEETAFASSQNSSSLSWKQTPPTTENCLLNSRMKLSGRQNGETTCQYGILRRSHSHVIPNRFSDEESAFVRITDSSRLGTASPRITATASPPSPHHPSRQRRCTASCTATDRRPSWTAIASSSRHPHLCRLYIPCPTRQV